MRDNCRLDDKYFKGPCGLRTPRDEKVKQGPRGIKGVQGEKGPSGPVLDDFRIIYKEYYNGTDTGGFSNTPINNNYSFMETYLQSGYYQVSYSITIGSTKETSNNLYEFAIALNDEVIQSSAQGSFFTQTTTPSINISATVIITAIDNNSKMNLVLVDPVKPPEPNESFIIRAATLSIIRLGDI